MCKLVLMEVECSNTSSGWKYLDHLKLVFNDIGLDHFNSNEINSNIFKTFFESCIRFGLVWFMVFNVTVNNISVISWPSVLLVEETKVHRENHRPVANH